MNEDVCNFFYQTVLTKRRLALFIYCDFQKKQTMPSSNKYFLSINRNWHAFFQPKEMHDLSVSTLT